MFSTVGRANKDLTTRVSCGGGVGAGCENR